MGAVALSACAANAGDAPSEDLATSEQAVTAAAESFGTADTSATAAATATGTAFIVGTIKDSTGLPVPGAFVNITGPASHSAVTNSNGVYFFGSLPNGTYTVKPSKPGGVFAVSSSSSATSTTVVAGAAGVEAEFLCKSGCDGAATVVPLKELTIVDRSVVNDARASSATDGPWSFRFLMEQMTPSGVDPSDFVLNWLQGFKSSAGPINGFPVENRAIQTGLIDIWPKKSNGKLDLAKAPFQLLAIVNRTDLHIQGSGEARFVFGMVQTSSTDTFGQSFTVIFEYRLPLTDASGAQVLRKQWVSDFHALGSVAFGSTFNSRLQTITDKFTRAGTTPGNPNGNSISQVRTNEIQFGGPWQLREFHLVKDSTGKGFLKLSPTAQTADFTLNGTSGLATFIKNNRIKYDHALQDLSSTFIGGQSDEVGTWDFSSFAVAERERHAFAGQTCNGCHSGETAQLDGFYMISPLHVGSSRVGTDGKDSLAPFVIDVELPRRKRFMQNRLVCTGGADCSPGAEAAAL